VLVVRGVDPIDFYDQVFATYALGADEPDKRRLPALLITDTPPTDINEDRSRLENAKMVVLHLWEHYQGHGAVTDVLRKLALTVKEPNAFKSLQALDKEKIKKYWGWLTSYLELKPSFFGFGVNINAILDDLFFRPRR
jgi:hypothetical protein